MNYNVTQMDDNIKDVISGLKEVRRLIEPEYRPYINYTIWLITNLKRNIAIRKFQLLFYSKHFQPNGSRHIHDVTDLELLNLKSVD